MQFFYYSKLAPYCKLDFLKAQIEIKKENPAELRIKLLGRKHQEDRQIVNTLRITGSQEVSHYKAV